MRAAIVPVTAIGIDTHPFPAPKRIRRNSIAADTQIIRFFPSNPCFSSSGLAIFALFRVRHQARVVHPDVIPCEYPGKDEDVRRTENHAPRIKPAETRKGLEKSMMQFDAPRRPERQEPPEQTQYVRNFAAENAFPTIQLQR